MMKSLEKILHACGRFFEVLGKKPFLKQKYIFLPRVFFGQPALAYGI
jgi:hypothetical protein